eukprot:428680_1
MSNRDHELLFADLTWIDGTFHENIGVLINTSSGIIENVYNMDKTSETFVDVPRKYFKNKALIPGLINCHSHCFQRGLRGFGEEYPQSNTDDDFWGWRDKMYDLVQTCSKNELYTLAYQAFYEMRRTGICSVGEFHYFHHNNADKFDYEMDNIILKAANDVGIRIVLLETYYNSAGCGKPIAMKQKRFYTPTLNNYFQQIKNLQREAINNPLQTIGIVAHSIRAAHIDDIKELHKYSVENDMVFHMHIDEQINEIIQCKKYYGREPSNLLLNNLNVKNLNNVTTIHNTLTATNDLYKMINNDSKICICPLTECNLGDGIFNLDLDNIFEQNKLIKKIVIGTDCNERIDLFEELRMLEYSQRLKYRKRGIYSNKSGNPNLSNLLFNIATIQGSKSLNLNNGIIKKKKLADLVCIDLSAMCLKGWTKNTLLSSLIFGCSGYEVISDSCIHGKWIHFNLKQLSNSKL